MPRRAPIRSRSSGRRAGWQSLPDVQRARAACASDLASPSMSRSAWAWSAGTSPRGSSSASMHSSCCWSRSRGCAARSRCCRSPPLAQQAAGLSGAAAGDAGRGRAHQRALCARRLETHRADRQAPAARAGVRAVSRRGLLHRQQPARRHEPGGQGVCRRARRRRRRTHPEYFHRRVARAGGSDAGQSVRRGRDRGRDPPRDARCRASNDRAHAAHAPHRKGEQCLSLGRAHADGCGAYPPAPGACQLARTRR